jgi:hypothetical protein
MPGIAHTSLRLTSLRYSAVPRSANAYVPPGARKNATSGTATPSSQPTPGPAVPPGATKPTTEEAAKSSEAAGLASTPGTVAGSTPAQTKVCIERLYDFLSELIAA